MSDVLLLDSNVLLWWLMGSERLSPQGAALVAGSDAAVSVVTPWELWLKAAKAGLSFPEPLQDRLEADGISVLPMTLEDCRSAAYLPPHHRDPFDRLIIAQALARNVPVMTSDRVFEAYGVTVVAP